LKKVFFIEFFFSFLFRFQFLNCKKKQN